VESRRQITEEDLLVTEALIAESYGRLKRSVSQVPSRALRSTARTIGRHPLATAATVALAGILAYRLIGLVTSRPGGAGGAPRATAKPARPNLPMEILSMVLPLAAPYLADLVKGSLERILGGEREGGHRGAGGRPL
jgi:hypothetical protein